MEPLPSIPPDANKYTRGSLLILAGSARYPGAAVMAAQAAARTGAGYVTLAVPGRVAATCAHAHLLSIPVMEVAESERSSGVFSASAYDDLASRLSHCDAIILGFGITVTPSTIALVANVLRDAEVPVVLDADALNAIAADDDNHDDENRAAQALIQSKLSCVLTPHAGELARLLRTFSVNDADDLARKTGSVVVAKGPTTHITDGASSIDSSDGTPALAKAGTGDVLAGIIGSLVAQGMSALAAAKAGVHIHGVAGRIAADRLGVRGVMAEDVIEAIPQAMLQ
ncbi:MAG: NAD(P)H-hydrate dehydratase [Coriobacteriales bacterium]|jgi:NAD(P)H-hydrate epimerase|nr:NAD(P)H-hydrate dehydratase [Coriobacteriales bacterium]